MSTKPTANRPAIADRTTTESELHGQAGPQSWQVGSSTAPPALPVGAGRTTLGR